jgi:5-carboxymethyl-2-hydroxymuconate isomerase
MPHFSIEYSKNLDSEMDMFAFCKTVHAAILETGLFELGAVRVRAFEANYAVVTDMHAKNAFIDMIFRVGQGRSPEALKTAGEHIFKTANDYVQKFFEAPHFALSFEIQEINTALSWKKNSMHARLR